MRERNQTLSFQGASSATVELEDVRAIQADALRHAAELCREMSLLYHSAEHIAETLDKEADSLTKP